jgi:hypothetical protein
VTLPSCASATGTLYKLMVTKTTAGNLLTFQAQAGDQIFYSADTTELTSSQGGTISTAPSSVLSSTIATTGGLDNNDLIVGEISCSVDGIWWGRSNGDATGTTAT